jgi:hypothetical protein
LTPQHPLFFSGLQPLFFSGLQPLFFSGLRLCIASRRRFDFVPLLLRFPTAGPLLPAIQNPPQLPPFKGGQGGFKLFLFVFFWNNSNQASALSA